jgi:hypothetical protein
LHGKKGSHALNKDDQKQLRFLYQYSDIVFEDNEENRKKFAALMLICVYLMNDREEIARRTKQVEDLLMSEVGSLKAEVGNSHSSLFTLHSSLDCYLAIALFIVKHEASLRQQAKAWCKSHPDCPLVIRRFLSIAKQIRC